VRQIPRTRKITVAVVLLACGHLIAATQPFAQIMGKGGTYGPGSGEVPSAKSPGEGDWPHVHIQDAYTRDAAKRALQGASRWLARPRCQSLFSEFQDERQLPLTEKLRELETDPGRYLRLVVFQDGAQSSTCKRHGILAFTARGSRVIYLCGRDFERAWRRDPREAQAFVIHEVLHSLGLGENPPSPRHITHRVQQLCWD
jgi:hypothetical protein